MVNLGEIETAPLEATPVVADVDAVCAAASVFVGGAAVAGDGAAFISAALRS